MRLSEENLKALCGAKGLTLGALLAQAGVSRTAYYAMRRKASVLPRSVRAIAESLGVPPSGILDEAEPVEIRATRVRAEVDRIARWHPDVDRDTLRHTLVLLEEPPLERLRRALRRGQA
ncbi:MAG: hypothetical protein V1809_12460 [Planctomycetota bacterium]